MGIQLLPTANALDVYQGVMSEMARLEKSFPPGLEWRLAFDNVGVVRESIKEVLVTLGEAILLVLLVMFLFLQNWRSTLIPAITIPVSLIGTFAFVKLFGFSINTLTLFGIVLATGIVVDDAIVVIENIERHMREEGKPAYRAAIDAMDEVMGAVIVIGLVLVAVFVPVSFFPGTAGRLYQQFSLTIAFAVVLSVFNAVTFTPALSALLLDKESHSHGRFFSAVNRVIEGGTTFYVRTLKLALARRPLMLALFVLGLVATWWLVRTVPSAFVPEEDEGYFISVIQAPAGASLGYTTEIAKQAEAILFKEGDIRAAFSVVGFSFAGAAPNNGLIFTRLKDYHERPGKDHSLAAVLGRIRGPLMGITGGLVIPFAPPGIQGLSVFGGFQYQLLDQTGGDIGRLAETIGSLTGAANTSGQVVGLFSSFRANDPQLVVDLDRDRARSLDLPLREVTDALQVFLGSAYVNDFDFNNRAYRVYVQADQQYRADPNALRQLYARATSGAMVPLDSVVRAHETTAPQVISHFNLFRSAEINGAAAPGTSSGQALLAMERISRETLPPGFDFAWSGLSLEEKKSGAQAVFLFALSLIVVYLVLAAQYESWVLPFIILLGVPHRDHRRPRRPAPAGPRQRRLLPGRPRAADRARGQELDPDRRVRGAAARAWPPDRGRGGRGQPDPAAADPDDVVRVHPRRAAARLRHRRRRRRAQLRRHLGGRRHARLHFALGHLHPGALRRDPLAGARASCAGAPRRRAGRGRGGEWRAMSRRLVSLGLALLGLGLAAARQPPRAQVTSDSPVLEQVTFEEAVSRATSHNPSVAEAAQAILRAEALLSEARSVFLPLAYGNAGTAVLDAARGFGDNIVQPKTQTAFSATASYSVLERRRLGREEPGRGPGGDRQGRRPGDAAAGRRQRGPGLPRRDRGRAAARDRRAQPRHGQGPRRLRSHPTRCRPGKPPEPREVAAAAGDRRGPRGARRAAGAPGAGGPGRRRVRPGPAGRQGRAHAAAGVRSGGRLVARTAAGHPAPDVRVRGRRARRLRRVEELAPDRDCVLHPALRDARRSLRAVEVLAGVLLARGPDLRRHAPPAEARLRSPSARRPGSGSTRARTRRARRCASRRSR